MPIIYSYPSKASPSAGDLLVISDISASNQTKKITIGDIQTTLSLVDGSGTLNKISKWSDANTLTDSIITEDPAGPGISVAGTLSITGGSNYLFLPSILDNSGSQGTANQVLSAGPIGGSIKWVNGTGVVTSYTNGTDNRVLTSSGATTINGESNLTFDGTDLALTGSFAATSSGTNTAVRGIATNSTSTQGWATNLGVANFDQNDTGAFCTTIAVNTEATNGKLISFYYQENSGTGPKGEIKYDTGTSQIQYNVTSDYRLKENIVDLTSALDRVKNLKPKRFNLIGNATEIDGFLAHEVQEVVPQAVSGTKDQVFEDGQVNPQQMDASKLVPVLTAAIKELTARLEALESK